MRDKFKKLLQSEAITKRQFPIFIGGSIVVAIGLIYVSLWLYNESGAAQLDLSRPSYQAAREESAREDKADKTKNKSDDFAADGSIDKKSIEEFKKLYKSRLDKIKANAFKEDPLSDQTLNITKEDSAPHENADTPKE